MKGRSLWGRSQPEEGTGRLWAWLCGEAWPRRGIFDGNGRGTEGWGLHRRKVGERSQS